MKKLEFDIHGPRDGFVVYEIRGADGAALYVGSTRKLRQRLLAHNGWIKFQPAGVTVHTYGPYDTEWEMQKAEETLIQELAPSRNLAKICAPMLPPAPVPV